MIESESVCERLAYRINKPDILAVVSWAKSDRHNLMKLYGLCKSPDERVSINALWCLTYIQQSETDHFQSMQNDFIDMLLVEPHVGKRRLLFKLLREQSFDKDSLRTDFLDYCLSKINSECEAYAVRSSSIYCAFKMCRCYPELIVELEQYLDLLSHQSLSPGVAGALRITRKHISSMKN